MNLNFNNSIANGYTSNSQIARVLTEDWVSNNIYCPACGSKKLNDFANNSPVADFYCNNCKAEFELKSKNNSSTMKIVDGAYGTMIQRINSENNPNFFFLNYSNRDMSVKNFIVIPKHYFFDDIIEKRKPLSPTARRAGWIGCNILLKSIPNSGKIFLVQDSKVIPIYEVLKNWEKTAFLSTQKKESRGWTIEIMKLIERIKEKQFSLNEIYFFEKELKEKFPNNNFIKDKIRQQLQILREKKLIEFNGRGTYVKLI